MPISAKSLSERKWVPIFMGCLLSTIITHYLIIAILDPPGEMAEVWLSPSFLTTSPHKRAAFFSATKKLERERVKEQHQEQTHTRKVPPSVP